MPHEHKFTPLDLKRVELAPYDSEVIEVCLARLGKRPHPAVPLLKGRLAVARG